MNSTAALSLTQKAELKALKLMGLMESLVLFGVPAAAYAASTV